MEVFKKIIVKNGKKDIPEDGQYSTDLGYIEVFCGNWVADDYPEWYLEEVELPSDKEIDSTFPLQYEKETLLFNSDVRKGMKLLRDYILGK